MLGGDIPVGIWIGADDVAGALALGVKHASQLEEPDATASRDKNFVEFEMGDIPFVVEQPVVEETRSANQLMMRADEPLFPS